ncbi:hypothetical protein M8A51_17340 [Schlegelella sp. S2-27]|uniref:Response regulatory domain-containing protein n=1 Tax=Caldimonas mangrovi TaxID=2944811 RepID=A0ABT0YRB7_9BURK|nr:hypothetical protein [Caldimonas mangrovi]MCM5681293.1 hypothetical protein [Caldimonas mangrovi]
MRSDPLPLLHGAPASRWVPGVLVLAPDTTAQQFAARACRHFEPHAHVQACAHLADAFRRIVAGTPDLLLLDPALAGEQLAALLQHARRFRPALTIALIGATPPRVSTPRAAERPDACLEWAELTPWLAQVLPRLRCRAQLEALQVGAFGDTTKPADLVPAA